METWKSLLSQIDKDLIRIRRLKKMAEKECPQFVGEYEELLQEYKDWRRNTLERGARK